MSERRTAAITTLERLGIDPEAPAVEQVAAVLAGPEGTAIVAALAEVATAPTAALLVSLEARTPDRVLRKEIRRALYRLRQRGVPVPEPPAAPLAPRATGSDPEAFVTAFTGDGERLACLVKPLAEGGSLIVYAQLHEPRGLLALTAGEIARKRLRAFRQQLEADTGFRLVPADWRTVDALLVEAEGRAGGDDPKRSYLRVRARITSEPPRPPAEPVSARVTPATAEEAAALVAGSAGLLAEPELRTWGPRLEAAAPFVDELAAARESPLVLSREAEGERVREVIRRAVLALAPPAAVARRLEGTAYVLAESGRIPLARAAQAVAAALRERPEAAPDIPFVVALVERVLGAVLATQTERRQEEQRGSLVVTPGQFLRDRSSSRPTRTRG